ncbi:hypothetical protein KIW84_075576 [Lathyrus oleraceus]|uniref:Uncharacterized protein n=1 Tax=Pisum sativum TaxID=3888 RepID=A0A9D4VVQ5_PEA|nr:hypothetical protein KIW84_075576 [Pisum sativum]
MFPGFMRKPDKTAALKELKAHVAMFGTWVVVIYQTTLLGNSESEAVQVPVDLVTDWVLILKEATSRASCPASMLLAIPWLTLGNVAILRELESWKYS